MRTKMMDFPCHENKNVMEIFILGERTYIKSLFFSFTIPLISFLNLMFFTNKISLHKAMINIFKILLFFHLRYFYLVSSLLRVPLIASDHGVVVCIRTPCQSGRGEQS